jgi:hypothetical protein
MEDVIPAMALNAPTLKYVSWMKIETLYADVQRPARTNTSQFVAQMGIHIAINVGYGYSLVERDRAFESYMRANVTQREIIPALR